MYLLGHIGIIVFILFLLDLIKDLELKKYRLFVGLGAMLPDLIDKPIGSIFFNTGRWFGHSLVFLISVFLISYALYRTKSLYEYKGDKIILTLFGASLLHLITDLPGISMKVMFWPFFGNFEEGNKDDFLHGFESTFVILTEILGVSLLSLIGIYEKWDKKEWSYLIFLIISYLSTFVIVYLVITG